MDEKENNKINEVLKNRLKSISKIMKSPSFICSMYFLAYLDNCNETTWNRFIELFNKLDYDERIKVIANVDANLKERAKNKVKKKGNDKYE